MNPLRLYREFDAPWPAVLVEIKDFIDLARLSTGGAYQAMAVKVELAKSLVSAESLAARPASPFGQFRAILASLPRCQLDYAATERSAHRVHIEILRY
jgi:hypothetical protein